MKTKLQKIARSIGKFLRDESGPTSVEYAVIVMLILLAVITSVQALGNLTAGSLDDSAAKIEAASSGN